MSKVRSGDLRLVFPFKEHPLKPLSDCSTFTFEHFVILCGGVMQKTNKKKLTTCE